MPVDNRYDGRGENPPYKVGHEVHGMDEWLFERYEQLRELHERVEDIRHNWRCGERVGEHMKQLEYDLQKMRDDAKAEYDSF